MKKSAFIFVLFLTACGSLPPVAQPTPIVNQDPTLLPTATALVNQYPTLLPTPTLAVMTRPIGEEEMPEALNFFYELKNRVALGQYEHFAEEIRYPITVQVDAAPKTFIFAAEFEANFQRIFSKELIRKFISTDESELTFTPKGVKVADGMLWFDLICMDPGCEEAEFLITEINN